MSSALKPKHQRLVLALIAIAALIGAALLAVWALREQASLGGFDTVTFTELLPGLEADDRVEVEVSGARTAYGLPRLPRVTKKQERDRARRRWEKQQATAAARAAKRDRARRIAAIVATVAVVAALIGGLALALKPEAPPAPEKTAAGCEQPPQPLGTAAKLELFARSERPGWDAWGNEVGKLDRAAQ